MLARMTAIPTWLSDLPTSELGLTQLADDEREQTRELWRSTWEQVPFGETFSEACAQRIERCVPLFAGPVRHRRLGKHAAQLIVVHDPAHPNEAWLSLSHAMPSLTWAPGGSSRAQLAAALARYTVDGAPDRLELGGHQRVLKTIDVDDPSVVLRAIEGYELWIDDAAWGSAHVEDPWADQPADPNMMMLSIIMQRAGEQHPQRAYATSMRTLWSRSILTIEEHPFGLWVFDLRYAPAADERATEIATVMDNTERFGALPADLVASLLRGDSYTLDMFDGVPLEAWGPFEAAAVCALAPGEGATVARLRELIAAWADDAERFPALLDILSGFDHRALLFEAATHVRDPELLASLHEQLRPDADDEPADDDDEWEEDDA